MAKIGTSTGIALIFFSVLYSLFLPKDQFQLNKEKLVKNPHDFKAHLELAEKFLDNNQFTEAEKVLLLAQNEQTSAESKQLWQRKYLQDPEDIQRLTDSWEKIVEEKPNYRDAYLQLTDLYYRLCENEKAKDYLEKAIELDPNFEAAQELKTLISKI